MTDPRREAPALSNVQVAADAIVTDQDRALSRAFWERHGTPLFRAMLDADVEEEA